MGQIALTRTYRSQVASTADEANPYEEREPLGPGWLLDAAGCLEVSRKHLRLWDGSGSYVDLPYDRAPRGAFLTLERRTAVTADQSAYEITDPQKNVTHYDVDGAPRFFRDRRGNRTEYEYDAWRRLMKIKDPIAPDRRWIELRYFNEGDVVKAKVLDVDVEKERISLGIKQVASDPMADADFRKGQIITVEVVDVATGGIEVAFGEGNALRSFIRKSDLSRDRSEQRTDRFAVGDRIDAMVTGFDKQSRRVSLSIKAMELADEKEAIAQFGSSDSGASLGDILGAALKDRK